MDHATLSALATGILAFAPGELIGDCRGLLYVEARAVVAKVLNERGYSAAGVGRVMRRDHSTILNLLDKWSIYCRRNMTVGESYRKHIAWMCDADIRSAVAA